MPGGFGNVAGGSFSFAAGQRARVRDPDATGDGNGDEGTFVWADSEDATFTSTGPDQFLIRASGGVGIGINAPSSPLTVAGTIESTEGGIKFPDGTTQTTASGGGGAWQLGGNAGTDPPTDFLGTTDDTPLGIRVSSERVMRYEPGTAEDGPNVIGGYSGNRVADDVVGATIAGGGEPLSSGGSELENKVLSNYGTVGGGSGNTASGSRATVGGGDTNEANALRATVSGGAGNTASGQMSAVAGGLDNTASGTRTTVSGGGHNTASGTEATVPGGRDNVAGGDYSFAAGRRAIVRDPDATGDSDGDEGTFVWADSEDADFASTGSNQFLIRAGGGVGIGEDAPLSALHVTGNESALGGDDGVPGPPDTALNNDDLILEDADAVIGLYSGSGGARGSVINLGEVEGGALSDV